MMWKGGGLVPVLLAIRFVPVRETNESLPHEDRHQAPTSTQPFPLSLQKLSNSFVKHHQNRGRLMPILMVKFIGELPDNVIIYFHHRKV